jgi:two-component system response regulator FixJ
MRPADSIPDRSKKLVLVVDDDPAVCASLKFALELEGFRVETHAGGAELFANPDLAGAACVILDHRMPEMDGLAVLSKLADQSIKVPVILIAALVNEKLRSRAARLGAFSVLEKPLLNGSLLNKLREAIAG